MQRSLESLAFEEWHIVPWVETTAVSEGGLVSLVAVALPRSVLGRIELVFEEASSLSQMEFRLLFVVLFQLVQLPDFEPGSRG
jgi:hypothetical protein